MVELNAALLRRCGRPSHFGPLAKAYNQNEKDCCTDERDSGDNHSKLEPFFEEALYRVTKQEDQGSDG